jgi:hypothetical protein
MHRDEIIIKLRPFIESIDTKKSMTNIENFQNNTLRPILKFQNDILISLIKENNHYDSLIKEVNTNQDTLILIKNFINKETQLKLTIIGVLIGLYTLSELEFYHNNSKELNKRIIQMTAQRFFDKKTSN